MQIVAEAEGSRAYTGLTGLTAGTPGAETETPLPTLLSCVPVVGKEENLESLAGADNIIDQICQLLAKPTYT